MPPCFRASVATSRCAADAKARRSPIRPRRVATGIFLNAAGKRQLCLFVSTGMTGFHTPTQLTLHQPEALPTLVPERQPWIRGGDLAGTAPRFRHGKTRPKATAGVPAAAST